jgi:hypothetical protein
VDLRTMWDAVESSFKGAFDARRALIADAREKGGEELVLALGDAGRWAGEPRFDADKPSNVTPQMLTITIVESASACTPEEFGARYAQPCGSVLASQAILEGLNTFAPVVLDDRPEARAPIAGSPGRFNKRPRAFVVRILGWRA